MSDPNANRPGYKASKVGWIPLEWDEKPLYSLTHPKKPIVYGIVQAGPDIPDGVPYIRSTDVGNPLVATTKLLRTASEIAAKYKRSRVEKDDLVFSLRGNIGATSKVPAEIDGANLTQGTARISLADKDHCDYVRHALSGYEVRRLVDSLAKGSTFREITIEDLRKVPIPYPPSMERKKIARILSIHDDAIEHVNALIDAKKRQRKILQKQLLTSEKRLPKFTGPWKKVKLASICQRLREVAENPSDYPVLSITAGTGFVSQADKFSRVIAGKQVENYVILKRGEFSYNKGNSYRYPQGCVYRLSEYEAGLVPDVFYSFKLNESLANPEFIKQYFLAGLHNRSLYRWINSGVRNNGLLNLSSTDFFKLPIGLPPLNEQVAIGGILAAADAELGALENKLTALKQQKKGLMQKLLTGQIRVKV